MRTCYSQPYDPPKPRVGRDVLGDSLHVLTSHPWVDSLMTAASSLLAILNDRRQVLAINDYFAQTLGVARTDDVFGLRPGEVLGCDFARCGAEGCGTSPMCPSCGAAVAIATAEGLGKPKTTKCAIRATQNGRETSRCFRVRAAPLRLGDYRYVVLLIDDITQPERWAALQRTFFHGTAGIIQGLVGASQLALRRSEGRARKLMGTINGLALRLADELMIQRRLIQDEECSLTAGMTETCTSRIIRSLEEQVSTNEEWKGIHLDLEEAKGDISLYTVPSLALRVLINMVTNAMEASEEGDTVKVRVSRGPCVVGIHVWNRRTIPYGMAARIFQLHASTKEEPGHGIGTFSMKLIGEELLGGKVSFTTDDEEGTTFTLELPSE